MTDTGLGLIFQRFRFRLGSIKNNQRRLPFDFLREPRYTEHANVILLATGSAPFRFTSAMGSLVVVLGIGLLYERRTSSLDFLIEFAG